MPKRSRGKRHSHEEPLRHPRPTIGAQGTDSEHHIYDWPPMWRSSGLGNLEPIWPASACECRSQLQRHDRKHNNTNVARILALSAMFVRTFSRPPFRTCTSKSIRLSDLHQDQHLTKGWWASCQQGVQPGMPIRRAEPKDRSLPNLVDSEPTLPKVGRNLAETFPALVDTGQTVCGSRPLWHWTESCKFMRSPFARATPTSEETSAIPKRLTPKLKHLQEAPYWPSAHPAHSSRNESKVSAECNASLRSLHSRDNSSTDCEANRKTHPASPVPLDCTWLPSDLSTRKSEWRSATSKRWPTRAAASVLPSP